jgi:hypothetical protein
VKFSLSGRDSSVKSALTELEKKFEELGLNSNKISKFSVLLGKMFFYVLETFLCHYLNVIDLSLVVSTSRPIEIEIENVLSGRDQFLKLVEIFSTVEIDFYFISVEIFKIEIFRSRFIFVEIFIEIVKTNRDRRDKSRLSRLSRFIENFRDFST